jgi:hypothetical protein
MRTTRPRPAGAAFDLQLASWPTRTSTESAALSVASSSSRDRSTISTTLAVDGHALAGLRQALRHHAADRRACSTVSSSPCGHVGGGQRGLVGGLRGVQVGQRGVQRGARDEALVDQRLVVVVLRWAMSICALAASACSLAWRRRALDFGGVDARDHLAGLDHVAFAHRQPCSSPATRALTNALLTALSEPDTGRFCDRSRGCGLQDVGGGEFHHRWPWRAGAPAAAAAPCARPARATPPATSSTSAASATSSAGGFMGCPAGAGGAHRPGHQVVDLRGRRSARGRAGSPAAAQAPSECFIMIRKIMGATTEYTA